MRKNHLQVVFLIRRRADSPFVRQHRVASLQAAGIVFRRHPVGSSSLSLGDDTHLSPCARKRQNRPLQDGFSFSGAERTRLSFGNLVLPHCRPLVSSSADILSAHPRYHSATIPFESLCPKTTKPPFAGRFFIFRRRADSNR